MVSSHHLGTLLSGRQVPVASGGHPNSARPCHPHLILKHRAPQSSGASAYRQGGAPGSAE